MSVDSPEQLKGLKRAGALVALTLRSLRGAVAPGVTTGYLDRLAAELFEARGARSGPILTYGYPGSVCISVDDEVVHGVPGGRRLELGQLVTLDVAAELDGYHADAAITVPVGQASASSSRLVSATRAALSAGIRAAQPGASLRDVGAAIDRTARARGFRVFRELTGHGIGRSMHEKPTVFNWPSPHANRRQTRGLVITIEPMLASGTTRLQVDPDGWTVRTRDGSLSAHEEHTIVVTANGPLVLTANGPLVLTSGTRRQTSSAAADADAAASVSQRFPPVRSLNLRRDRDPLEHRRRYRHTAAVQLPRCRAPGPRSIDRPIVPPAL